MNISVEWREGKYPSFNVSLASKDGAEPFLTIRGCRIGDGQKGAFVSYPAKKNEQTGKWWNHAWANDEFNRVVLEKAMAAMSPKKSRQAEVSAEEDIPFANPLRGVRALVQ